MNENLNFKPGYYKITKLVEPNVIEIEDTWFVKLKGVSDTTPKEEIKKWLKEGNIVRIIPYKRSNDARIISDVWLGNTHINKQFFNYKRDNFIQAFEYWTSLNSERFSSAEDELIQAFYTAETSLPDQLRYSFKQWVDSRYPQEKIGLPIMKFEKREEIKNQMFKDFNKWRKEQMNG